jgi:hypothetical protein
MIPLDRIEKVFARRSMPAEVIESEQYLQFDSDVEEALWFAGKDWHDLTWKEHPCAIGYFSRDAFIYYLPSVIFLSFQNPRDCLDAADTVIHDLDISPAAENWTYGVVHHYLGLYPEEYDLLKEWLLIICEFSQYQGVGRAASGPGELLGRAFDTLDLLQKETERLELMDQNNLPDPFKTWIRR